MKLKSTPTRRSPGLTTGITIATQRGVLLVAVCLQVVSPGCGGGAGRERDQRSSQTSSPRRDEDIRREAEKAAKAAEAAAREAKAREDAARRQRRHCMSQEDAVAYEWVAQQLFAKMIESGVDAMLAKARTEIATARAFDLEPANWAKRDVGALVERHQTFEKQRIDVEGRLKAAEEHANAIVRQTLDDKDWDPHKNARIFWFQGARDQDPKNPYAIAINAQRKIEHEREELYHRFGLETPEEKAGGALAILFWMVAMGGGRGGAGRAALTAEARAAMTSVGTAEAALAAGRSEAALASIGRARSVLTAAGETEALAAVGRARAAVVGGELESASVALAEARAALTNLQAYPAGRLAFAAAIQSGADRDAAEGADRELGAKERATIELFDNASAGQGDVVKFLGADLRAAFEVVAKYKTAVASGEIAPAAAQGILRKGC